MSKLKSDLWKQLVAEAGVAEEDAIARAASVSVKEAEEELAAAGFDVAAERAKASAFLHALESGTLETDPDAPVPEPPPSAAVAVAQVAPRVPTRPRRERQRPVVLWIAAVATAAVAGGALYVALHQPPTPEATPEPPPPSPSNPTPRPTSAPDLVAAAELRRQAAAACDAKQWSVCLAKLDLARAVDPDGDDAPAVKPLRERAIAETLKKPEP